MRTYPTKSSPLESVASATPAGGSPAGETPSGRHAAGGTPAGGRRRRGGLLRGALAAVLVGGFAAPASADPWPAWRGPNGDGISAEKNLPVTFGKSQGVLWRTPLPGAGGASPIVWGDKIFVTSAEGDDLVLLGIDTAGKVLWKQSLGGGNKDVRSDEGNSASPSPSTDGKHVWAMMGTGALGCFTVDGKPVWKLDLQQRYGKFDIQFGMASTPVLDDGRLYLQLLHSKGAWVIALDAADGKEIWKHQRTSDAIAECEHSYASPMMYRDPTTKYLLTHGADYIVAHNLKDGGELWRCGGLNPKGQKYNPTLRFVASPLAVPGLIVVPTAKNGPVLGLHTDGSGNLTDRKEAYFWRRENNTPDVPSPLVHDGLVYLCRENGVLICMDAKTGQELYQERTESDRHRASPVFADGKIYLTARRGTISVIQAGPKFERLAVNKLEEETTASPAFSDGRIYVRTFEALWAIGPK